MQRCEVSRHHVRSSGSVMDLNSAQLSENPALVCIWSSPQQHLKHELERIGDSADVGCLLLRAYVRSARHDRNILQVNVDHFGKKLICGTRSIDLADFKCSLSKA